MRFLSSLLVLGLLSGCGTLRQHPLRPPGLSVERKITLGGWPQTVVIRGRDRANPVLLFLHGGPGLPEIPVSHLNADLERNFTIVQWDQRGAGKSYAPDIPPGTMTVEELVRETTELSRLLCREFGKQKIYLVGFSAGSLIGALAAHRHPELYHAYVSLSQLVTIPDSELRLHRAGLAEAEAWGYPEIAAQMRAIGEPPYKTRGDERLINKITKEMQPRLPAPMRRPQEIALILQSPYYSLRDDLRISAGVKFSGELLEPDIRRRDLRKEAPEIDVPVWFFLGRYDTVLSAPLAADYFAQLRAPYGKHLVWFEQSDHILHLEEAARYRAELRRVLAETRGR